MKVSVESLIAQKIISENVRRIDGEFNIIIMSNFLTANEGENRINAIAMIQGLSKNMKDDGPFIIIEPGEKNSCINMKKIRNELINKGILNVFSPCIDIWENKVNYDCACFSTVRCFWQPPIIYEYLLKKGLYKARRRNVPFNYVVLRKDNLKNAI